MYITIETSSPEAVSAREVFDALSGTWLVSGVDVVDGDRYENPEMADQLS